MSSIVTDGLVGYWNSKHGVNGNIWENIAPATRGKYNGTITGSVVQVDGMYFDGVDDNILIQTPLEMLEAKSATIEFRIMINIPIRDSWLLTQGTGLNPIAQVVSRNVRFATTGTPSIPSNLSLKNGTKEEIYITFSHLNSGDFAIYVNGVFLQRANYPNTSIFNQNVMYIGSWRTGFMPNGIIDSVRLYNKVLTPQEISQNYAVRREVGFLLPDTTPPSNVVNLVETSTETSVTLNWVNPIDSDFKYVRIYRDNVLLKDNYLLTSYTDGELPTLVTYIYKITTVDASNNESTGVSITSKTSDTTPPNSITNTTQTRTETSVTLSWVNPIDSDFSHVNIYRDNVLLRDNYLLTSYTDNGLFPSTSYMYKITTVDTSNNESNGLNISVKTPDLTPPSNVINLVETSTETSVTLNWVNPIDSDFKYVRIYKNYILLKDNYLLKEYTDGSLRPSTNYIYKITTVDTSNNESTGVSITVKTPDLTPPNNVVNLVETSTKTSVTLNWVNPIDSDFKYVRIYRDNVLLKDNYLLKEYTDGSLRPSTNYIYKITTVDTSNNESTGVSITVKTNDVTPTSNFIITDGLVGYWNSKHGVNGNIWENIAPATRGKYNGDITGAIAREDGMYSDGIDTISIQTPIEVLNKKRNSTFQMYFKLISSETSFPVIFNQFYEDEYNTVNALEMYFNRNTNKLLFSYFEDNYEIDYEYSLHFSGDYTQGVYLTIVIDSIMMRFYCDGQLLQSSPIMNNKHAGELFITPDFMLNTPIYSFEGIVDNIRIYNKALSPEEIEQNYEVDAKVGLEEDREKEIPNVTKINISHYKVSKVIGLDISTLEFSFSEDVTEWKLALLGVSHDTGVILDSGGGASAEENIFSVIYSSDLYQEGENRINIYGKNELGWTKYVQL